MLEARAGWRSLGQCIAELLRASERGVVPMDRHVDPDELLAHLGSLGIALEQDRGAPPR